MGNQLLPTAPLLHCQFALCVEWGSLDLRHLDLSGNALTGILPLEWFDSRLDRSIQTLLLNSNHLSGSMSLTPSDLPALSCWSVANNVGLCGALPPLQTCGNINGTLLGAVAGGMYSLHIRTHAHMWRTTVVTCGC